MTLRFVYLPSPKPSCSDAVACRRHRADLLGPRRIGGPDGRERVDDLVGELLVADDERADGVGHRDGLLQGRSGTPLPMASGGGASSVPRISGVSASSRRPRVIAIARNTAMTSAVPVHTTTRPASS